MTFDEWAERTVLMTGGEVQLARAAWNAATLAEREACAALARKKFRVVGERNAAGNAIADDILKRSNKGVNARHE